MTADPVMGWAFAGVGAFMQGMALLLARRTFRLLRGGGRANGRVVRNETAMIESGSGPPRCFYFAVIESNTAEGERITFQSATGRRTASPPGTRVWVVFDPASPGGAELATFMTLGFFPAVTSLAGLVFLVAGITALV